jgi:hypothetical protein
MKFSTETLYTIFLVLCGLTIGTLFTLIYMIGILQCP